MDKTTMPLLMPNWAHNLDDYRRMFDLQDQDLQRSILDYPANISSFNAQMHALGLNQVVSGDASYDLRPLDMAKHVDYIIQQLALQLERYVDRIHPEKGKTLEDILNAWNHYAQLFLSDYSSGKIDGRYQPVHLPHLPFKDFQFELALCPDLLFRDQNALSEKIIIELCRVAQEVRIFPLLDEPREIATMLGPVMLTLQNKNYGIEIREVPYQLLKGNNAMLRVWATACVVSK